MRTIVQSFGGAEYKRVSKPTAKRLYADGKEIFVAPWKARFGNWYASFAMKKESDEDDFESRINAFIYYNCQCDEIGKYPAFYIRLGGDRR